MIRRTLFIAVLAAPFAGVASAADPVPCPQPGCLPGPHKEVVRRAAYGTKGETFCLPAASFRGILQSLFGSDCAEVRCEPPRCKVRLVKWEVTEERCTIRCVPAIQTSLPPVGVLLPASGVVKPPAGTVKAPPPDIFMPPPNNFPKR